MRIESRKRVWPWVLGVLGGVLVVGGMTFLVMMSLSYPKDEGGAVVETEPEEEPVVVEVTGKMLLTGNISWGRKINDAARASSLGVAYPFSGLFTFGREDYTDWIGGLECPVTDKGGVHNYNDEYNLLKFNCDPDYLPEFAKWFSVVSLGNNHTDNQGTEGWVETKDRLAGAGIQYFGHYDYRDTGEVCAVVAVNVWQEMSDGARKVAQLPMAFCGHHGVFGVPTAESLALVSEYAEVMPVVAMPHMGVEYKAESDALRERVYRGMIDAGAEFVAGDHPHWVQNAEVYNGRLIAYSMGNFMFDQTWDEEVRRSAAISAGFVVQGWEGWEEIATECAQGGLEVCRGLAGDAGLTRYGVEWVFDAVGTDTVDLVTQRAGEVVNGGVLDRLGWERVKRELEQ